MIIPESLRPGDLISFKYSVGSSDGFKNTYIFRAGTPVLLLEVFTATSQRYTAWNSFPLKNTHSLIDNVGTTAYPFSIEDENFSLSILWNDEPIFIFEVHPEDVQVLMTQTKKEAP
jgi:hypothetical protein